MIAQVASVAFMSASKNVGGDGRIGNAETDNYAINLFCLECFAYSLTINGLKLLNVLSAAGLVSNLWICASYLPVPLNARIARASCKFGCVVKPTFTS